MWGNRYIERAVKIAKERQREVEQERERDKKIYRRGIGEIEPETEKVKRDKKK